MTGTGTGARTPEITDVPGKRRFEAVLDGEVVGFAEYRRGDGEVELPHTVVEPAHEGKGIGSVLARAALDDARARGLRVLPTCPFIAAYIEKHPEYADLTDR